MTRHDPRPVPSPVRGRRHAAREDTTRRTEPLRVLLAEAQALVREGLKRVALEVDAACDFVEAADPAAARDALRGLPALDAAFFDEALFSTDELKQLRAEQPGLLLVALTARHDSSASARMLDAGVNALVPRSAPIDILGATLRVVLARDVCVRAILDSHVYAGRVSGPFLGARHGTGPLNLTSRQYNVLELIAQGRANKVIAAELGIGLRTVKGHVSVVLRALHADNRADAGRIARRWLARATSPRPPAATARTETAIR